MVKRLNVYEEDVEKGLTYIFLQSSKGYTTLDVKYIFSVTDKEGATGQCEVSEQGIPYADFATWQTAFLADMRAIGYIPMTLKGSYTPKSAAQTEFDYVTLDGTQKIPCRAKEKGCEGHIRLNQWEANGKKNRVIVCDKYKWTKGVNDELGHTNIFIPDGDVEASIITGNKDKRNKPISVVVDLPDFGKPYASQFTDTETTKEGEEEPF